MQENIDATTPGGKLIFHIFGAIGSVVTVERLHSALAAMARHVRPGGVLLVEPWLFPDGYTTGTVHALYVDQPLLKIARINVAAAQDRVSLLDFHYLVGTPEGVDQFTERHELGLFTQDEYRQAVVAAGLETSFDRYGLIGRGLLIGVRPVADGSRSGGGNHRGSIFRLQGATGNETGHMLARGAIL